MKTRKTELERFDDVVAMVQREFPHLAMEITRTHPFVDALAELPQQPGLDFPVSFNLQNYDELHLNVSALWVQYFPCGKPGVSERCLDAVRGVLSGEFRVLESVVWGKTAVARLQRPAGGGAWSTVASSFGFVWLLVPWRRSTRVVQNGTGV